MKTNIILDILDEKQTQINELVRYDRQVRIWGEEGQKKLTEATVTIIGDNALAKYTALPLTALGIGNIRILGTQKSQPNEHIIDIPLGNTTKTEGYAQGLTKLNPNITITGIPIDLETKLSTDFLRNSNIIIDTTNNPKSKHTAIDYAHKNNTPIITASVSESSARMTLAQQPISIEQLMPEFEEQQQNPIIALFWGGIIAEEIKKTILGDKNTLKKTLHYKQGSTQKFTAQTQQKIPFQKELYKNKTALAIGAGALGNMLTLSLAELGFGATDYLDNDTIESHNLNRQVCFSDAVGQSKAKTLARKHKTINPQSTTRGIQQKFDIKNGIYTIDAIKHRKYDVIFDLVDNLYTRAMIAAYAVINEIPLITAASSPTACEIATYIPGKTACLNHVFSDYYEKGKKEEIIRRQSCIAQPDPSVIITNQVAAGLAALEMCTIFEPRYGKPFNGIIKYATNLDSRLGQINIKETCNCHKHKETVPNLELK